jgi:RNA polymerase sigma-70 factor (ECF subfamily)
VRQDDLYLEAAEKYAAPLKRLVRAYEAEPERRRDLLQEIHIALWRSFEIYESRCSLRTWVYRIAHFTAASHVIKRSRLNRQLVSIEEIEAAPDPANTERDVEEREAFERLLELIQRLKPIDRQLMLLYLEDVDTAAIGEITGVSPANVRKKIYRIKSILARQFHEGETP